jgi:hypothetical protein
MLGLHLPWAVPRLTGLVAEVLEAQVYLAGALLELPTLSEAHPLSVQFPTSVPVPPLGVRREVRTLPVTF